MSPPEISMPVVMFPEKSNWADGWDNDFKSVIINMLKELKKDMNKRLDEDCKNKTIEWNKYNNSTYEVRI